MGLSRRPVRVGVTGNGISSLSECDGRENKRRKKQRGTYFKRRFQPFRVASVIAICFVLDLLVGLPYRLYLNLPARKLSPLRRGSHEQHGNTTCRGLPERLLNVQVVEPNVAPLTKVQVEDQMANNMVLEEHGTTGNKIMTCQRNRTFSPEQCRGVVKIYMHKSAYLHVKRCLQILQNTGITSRILYADDEKKLIVEEDIGFLTMMNSPIPKEDYADQMRRIHCILKQNMIIHRDYNFRNFIVSVKTGYIRIIDFGDAVVWQGGFWNCENFQRRNLENIFSLWWKRYNAKAELEGMIQKADPMIFGQRVWRPPSPKRNWNSMAQQRAGALLLPYQIAGKNENLE